MMNRPLFGLSMDKMNRLYMGAVMGWGGVIGSAVSFMVSGAFIWAVARLLNRDFPLSRIREARMIGLVFALFFLVEAVSGAVSYNGRDTLYQIVQNVPFLAFLPMYSRLSVSERPNVRDAVELAAMLGAFAAFALALTDSFWFGYRAEGGAGNAYPFALANFITFTIAFLASQRAKGRRRVLFALAALASASAIVLSGTRGLWPGLIVVPVICLWFYRDHIVRRHLLPAFSVALLAFGLIATPFVRDRVESLLEDYRNIVYEGKYSGSVGQRLTLWKAGWQLVKEAPVLGHGPGHSKELMLERTKAISGVPIGYSHFHNVFLNYAVRDGIPGVVAVALMLVCPVLFAWQKRRDEIGDYGLAMTAGITTSFLLSGLVNNMIGQDLSDSLFIVGMLTSAFFVFGNGRDSASQNAGSTALDGSKNPNRLFSDSIGFGDLRGGDNGGTGGILGH